MASLQQENIRAYKAYYSTFARDYEKRTRERARIIAKSMGKWIDLTNVEILDLGVGTGSVWKELYVHGIGNIHVVGLDVASGALRMAKQKNIPWLELYEQNAEYAHFFDCFDIVCAHGLLRHCENPRTVVQRAYEALKHSGLFFVEDMSLKDDVLRIIPKFTGEIEHYLKPSRRKTSFYLTDQELLQKIEKVGFNLKKRERVVYVERYNSIQQIKEFFLEKTMFGLCTYKSIPLKHQEECNKTFSRMLRKHLKEPKLHRHIFISLFQKV